MIILDILRDDFRAAIINTSTVLVLDKELKEDPTNRTLRDIVNYIAFQNHHLTIRETMHVYTMVVKANEYNDHSIIETFIEYHETSGEIRIEIFELVKKHYKEFY